MTHCNGRFARFWNCSALTPASLYLFEPDGLSLRRVAAVGHRSEFAKNFPLLSGPPELIQQIRACEGPRFLCGAKGCRFPAGADLRKKEQIESA